jgi:hypothetical protein
MHQHANYAFLAVFAATCLALPAESLAWGAVVTNSHDCYESGGYATAEEAKASALRNCRNHGVKNCRVRAVFNNACVAEADSKRSWSWAIGSNPSSAQKKALAKCGGSKAGCRITFTKCD